MARSLLCLLLLPATALAGEYRVPYATHDVAVVKGGRSLGEHARIEPGAFFALEVTGPAAGRFELRLELPARGGKPRRVELELVIDGAVRKKTVPVRADKGARYEGGDRAVLSAAISVPFEVGAGEHRVGLKLPPRLAGAVRVLGLSRAPPATSAQLSNEPPAPPPIELAAGPSSSTAAGAQPPAPPPTAVPPTGEPPALAATAGTPPVPEPELVQPPRQAQTNGGTRVTEEIMATEIGDSAEPARSSAGRIADATRSGDFLRLGPKVGGVLPRGDLKPGVSIGLVLELPLAAELAGSPLELSAYLEGGYSPLRQQDEVLIQGRGRTQMIQNTLVLPFELGLRLRLDLGAPLLAHAAVGLAMDVTRTELRAFSTPPERRNDVVFGVAGAVGAYLPLGPGGLLAELRYREVRADLGELGAVAEPTLATAALHLGYLVAFD